MKINFIEYKAKKGRAVKDKFFASVDIKRGILRIPKSTSSTALLQGKFIKFYYEPTKKIIGWKLRTDVRQEEMKDWRLIQKLTPKVQIYCFGVKGILEQFVPKITHNCNHLEIEHYKDYGLLSDREDIYYVRINQ